MSDSRRNSIRISIDSSFHELYKALSDGKDIEKAPFKTMKDLFMLAVCLGYRRNQRRPINSKQQIFHLTQFSEREDLPILKAIAIATTGDVQVLADIEKIITIAEEYAQAGFLEIKSTIVNQPNQPLWELVQLIRL